DEVPQKCGRQGPGPCPMTTRSPKAETLSLSSTRWSLLDVNGRHREAPFDAFGRPALVACWRQKEEPQYADFPVLELPRQHRRGDVLLCQSAGGHADRDSPLRHHDW